MSVTKHKQREIVFQFLFSEDCEGDSTLGLLMEKLAVPKSALREALGRAQCAREKFSEIDRLIAAHAHHYEFDRIPRAERAILRLALFELSEKALPPQVVVAEAIRLARKFVTPEAGAFIHAILAATLIDKGSSANL